MKEKGINVLLLVDQSWFDVVVRILALHISLPSQLRVLLHRSASRVVSTYRYGFKWPNECPTSFLPCKYDRAQQGRNRVGDSTMWIY